MRIRQKPDLCSVKQDIETQFDIRLLVDTFYGRVREDELIGPIFNTRIGDNWGPHLAKMYGFWEAMLFGANTYSGRPFPPHAQMPLEDRHFARWLYLFTTTVDELFEGEKAAEAKSRAASMAAMFHYKIEHIKTQGPLNIQ